MQRLLAVVWLAFAAIFQVSVAPQLSLHGAIPDLLLVSIVAWSLVRGPMAGLRWALVGGIALDLVSPEPLGSHTFSLIVVAFAAGFAERAFFRWNYPLLAMVVMVATVIYYLVLMGVMSSLGFHLSYLSVLTRIALPSAVLNGLISPALLWVLNRFDDWFPLPVQPEW